MRKQGDYGSACISLNPETRPNSLLELTHFGPEYLHPRGWEKKLATARPGNGVQPVSVRGCRSGLVGGQRHLDEKKKGLEPRRRDVRAV